MSKYATSRQIAEQLKRRITYRFAQRMLAKEMKLSESYLSDFLAGNREAGSSILLHLGYDVTPHYKKAKP